MNQEGAPDLITIAGPNGSGKTTVAGFLQSNQSIHRFLNADVIASGLGITPSKDTGEISAGRIMLQDLKRALVRKSSIAFESTMAGRSWISTFQAAKHYGYHITICYVIIDSPELAVQRVRQRVLEGGHHIPEQTIRRRYDRSLKLFFSVYQNLADSWYFFDNSQDSASLLAMKEGGELHIIEEEKFHVYKDFAS